MLPGLDEATSGAAERRLRDEQELWITTVRCDGQPQASVVGFLWDGNEFLILSRPGSGKVRSDRRDEARRHGNLAAIRQRIQSIINTAKSQLCLEHHGGRTPAGVMTRVAQRVLALAAAIWHNWATDAPVKRSLIAYDH